MGRCVTVGLAAVVLILALAAFGACGGSQGDQIVFVSAIDGDDEIYLLDPKTGVTTPITDNHNRDFAPRWSPNRKRIVYLSDEAGDLEINVVDRQGRELVRLTHSAGEDHFATWSPDGKRLAFVSQRDESPEIYVMGTEGSTPTRVTSNSDEDLLGDWSPNAEWLAFYKGSDSQEPGIWLRNPNGVNVVRLTSDLDSAPAWSPDDRHIAFVRTVEGNSDIYLVSRLADRTWRDETTMTRLTQHDAEDHMPTWSPDSAHLAFVSHRDGNAEIYVMQPDGSKQSRLTNNGAEDMSPVWSQDGEQIAFISHLYGASEIFVMSSDGTQQRRLTNNNSDDHSPDW
jgi:Tol biopolymer transport system component